MKIVCAEQAVVEAELVGGLLACPSCEGRWGVGLCAGAGHAPVLGGPAVAAASGAAVSWLREGAHVLLAEVWRGVSGFWETDLVHAPVTAVSEMPSSARQRRPGSPSRASAHRHHREPHSVNSSPRFRHRPPGARELDRTSNERHASDRGPKAVAGPQLGQRRLIRTEFVRENGVTMARWAEGAGW